MYSDDRFVRMELAKGRKNRNGSGGARGVELDRSAAYGFWRSRALYVMCKRIDNAS